MGDNPEKECEFSFSDFGWTHHDNSELSNYSDFMLLYGYADKLYLYRKSEIFDIDPDSSCASIFVSRAVEGSHIYMKALRAIALSNREYFDRMVSHYFYSFEIGKQDAS